jgi:hypothetical protein
MYKLNALIILLSIAALLMLAVAANAQAKPRMIVMTDIGADPDDQQSMVRLFVMANEFEIEGLLATTSTWQSTPRPDLINSLVNNYGNVRANLALHDSSFPIKSTC